MHTTSIADCYTPAIIGVLKGAIHTGFIKPAVTTLSEDSVFIHCDRSITLALSCELTTANIDTFGKYIGYLLKKRWPNLGLTEEYATLTKIDITYLSMTESFGTFIWVGINENN